MKASTRTIQYLNEHYGSAGNPAPDGIEALVSTIGAQLAAVEEVINFGDRFNDVVIVKVIACDKHPNADRLNVCKVDDGGKVQAAQRDQDGYIQVVCGAPNVHAGMLAAWLPPGSTVPSTANTDPFVLEARDIRGVTSNGMLASPRELTLSDWHEGILDIDETLGPISPGTMFVDAFHLRDDVIIDMENKMFTHRPDCFGLIGLAREIEGIQHRPYKSPDWYRLDPAFPGIEADELKLEVRNELPELVPRFTAVALSGIAVGQSPVWLQIDLARFGLRPVNNIVDYTNYYMLLTGQPLHAYDYDKVRERSGGEQATIVVRHPKEGEKIKLLNGKEVVPRSEAILIATDKELIGVGGVMGGADTEVDDQTTNIILEAATFDMYSIRRTSMTHGLFTDAVTRFTKGQSPLQNVAALNKIATQIRELPGGKIAGPLIDVNHVPEEAYKRGNIHPPIQVPAGFINDRLGFELSGEQMADLLKNVEFDVQQDGDTLTVQAPFWRTDVEIAEDVVEEVGRLYGYDHLPLMLPLRDLTPAQRNPSLEQYADIRRALASKGANEVLTYSFVHGQLLDKVGQDKTQAFQISNAISPDLQYYRLSLQPSLLEKVHPNIKAGYGQFALFELGKGHAKTDLDAEGLPKELDMAAFVFAADNKTAAAYSGAPYYMAHKYLTSLLHDQHAAYGVRYDPPAASQEEKASGNSWLAQILAPYEPKRTAIVRNEHGTILGVVGEFKAAVRRALKLPAFSAGFELFTNVLFEQSGQASRYVQLPRFPKVEQDICLKVAADLPYRELFDFVWTHLNERRPDSTYHTLAPIDIFQREDDTAHKQITLRLTLASFERTLTDQEVTKLLDIVASAARQKYAAERI